VENISLCIATAAEKPPCTGFGIILLIITCFSRTVFCWIATQPRVFVKNGPLSYLFPDWVSFSLITGG
jgi:hypothetical protein